MVNKLGPDGECICICEICGGPAGSRTHEAREMMFGFRTQFTYRQCQSCGSLQLLSIPEDLPRYYPRNYYSYVSNTKVPSTAGRLRGRACMLPLGYRLADGAKMRAIFETGLRPNWHVLDVGCGCGELLHYLSAIGCKHVTGIDPYLSPGFDSNGLDIRTCTCADLRGTKWDLIVLNHSFEHMPQPGNVLATIQRLLSDRGWLLIRTPVVNWAWEMYKTNWVQLDAPRHLFLYSERGLRSLAVRCALSVAKVKYDSTDFQFWGSELYERGLPLVENKGSAGFTVEQRDSFRRKAHELNLQGRGDQAAFFLRRA